MPSKKSAPQKSKSTKVTKRVRKDTHTSRVWGTDETTFSLPTDRNGKGDKQPFYLKGETKEEREKRLAARKALTLKSFEIAYADHHGRKAS